MSKDVDREAGMNGLYGALAAIKEGLPFADRIGVDMNCGYVRLTIIARDWWTFGLVFSKDEIEAAGDSGQLISSFVARARRAREASENGLNRTE